MKLNNNLKTILKVVFSFSLISYLIYRIDLSEVLVLIKTVDLKFVVLGFLTFIVTLIFSIIAMYSLFYNEKELNLKFFSWAYFKSWAFGMISPGKLGDLFIVYQCKKVGVPVSKAVVVYLMDKLISITILLILASYGIVFIFSDFLYVGYILILVGVISFVILLFLSRMGRNIVKRLLAKFKIKSLDGSMDHLREMFKNNKNSIFKAFIFQFIKWVIGAYYVLFLFYSINSFPTFDSVISALAIGKIIAYLPITLGGLGLRELTAVYLYSLVGIPEAATLSVYVIISIVTYLLVSIVLFITMKD